ncbi:WD40-repeat-containing domain protein [Melanogaster broomeanus]|nr:WD40-repeat-containing domain protein [Melanogaster broomeanus]
MNIPRGPPAALQTPGFAHYSIAWSPFYNTRIALASAANFGLVGNGRLHLVSLSPGPGGASVKIDKYFETQDALYDAAWSEMHENHLVTGSGDGSIKLWDVMLNDFPIRAWHEHSKEVFSVDWSNLKKDTFLSSSWDGNVKVWTPERPRSIATLQAHLSCVYQALFSPHQPDIIATCSTDGTIKIFDLRTPAYASGPMSNSFTNPVSAAVLTVPASGTELLSLDWNKYRPFVIASAGVDKMVKVWDCRMASTVSPSGQAVAGTCEINLPGHEYAIRKVQWSPHTPDVLATASYDMTCRVWTTSPMPGGSHMLHVHDPHTEFVAGCGWSLYDEGILASYNPEDILSASLQILYDYSPITHSSPGSVFTYTVKPGRVPARPLNQIELMTPDTQPSNWALHASSVWVSSLFIADHLEDLQIDSLPSQKIVRVLELGAGAGLPSILIGSMYQSASITVTDYPDDNLIRTLSDNVRRNGVSERCRAVPYGSGDPGNESLFDIVIAADTLWNPELHAPFIDTLCTCLKRSSDSRIHLVAGLHTGRYTIQAFLDGTKRSGLVVQSATEREVSGTQSRPWDVSRAEDEDERERRRWVVWMVLKWGDVAT